MFLCGKIDKNGFLWILRENFNKPMREGSEPPFKQAGCPFRKENHCGDWCPMFGTVWNDASRPYDLNDFRLEICKKTLSFNMLWDERPEPASDFDALK